MQSVIDELGRHRFLSFDRDHGTGARPSRSPTRRCCPSGIDSAVDEEGRVDISRRAALAAASPSGASPGATTSTCSAASGSPSTNAGGTPPRCASPPPSRSTSTPRSHGAMTTPRRRRPGLARGGGWPDGHGGVGGARRRGRRAGGRRSSGVRVRSIRPADRGDGQATGGGSTIGDLLNDGLERAARDFDLEPIEINGPFSDIDAELASLADSGTDLVVFTDFLFAESLATAAEKYPDTTWAFVDIPIPGTAAFTFAEQRCVPRGGGRGADIRDRHDRLRGRLADRDHRALPSRLRSGCPGSGSGDRDHRHVHVDGLLRLHA